MAQYAVREKIFSIGDDFWITDAGGNRVFLVDGKALRLRQTFELRDTSGSVLATVRRTLVSPLHHRSVIDLADGSQLEAAGWTPRPARTTRWCCAARLAWTESTTTKSATADHGLVSLVWRS